ncbi:beta-1,3-galactosyltransferase 5-like [Lingula anatina]|uniref:Hexosyltransferase n=1 Tax=Lingula anatina TaxID=7574 RepID=A0A1S3JJW5_LINAN|nr:beta-1,3-galactosyltransferase 5-like [Lingula anatina]|eukprot:XP_013410705.1 beta-1,3-galactosyltransferase 5-like [Lingula anatina]
MHCRKSRLLRLFTLIGIAVLFTIILVYLTHHVDHTGITQRRIGLTVFQSTNKTEDHLNFGENRLWIHTRPYQYLMNIEKVCAKSNVRDLFLIVLVLSRPDGFKRRHLVRTTWGSPKTVNGTEIRTVYILGGSNNTNTQQKLQEEQAQYGDLVQIDFRDSYDNLTVKTVMGLRWASTFCPRAKFVMKTDDDMFVNYMLLVQYLKDLTPQDQELLYAGSINGNLHPVRVAEYVSEKKWVVPVEEYPDEDYPPYCSGGAYVLSGRAAKSIYETSKTTPFFRMEDVFVGICANKTRIYPTDYIGFSSSWFAYSDCRFRFLITAHDSSVKNFIKNVWKRVNSERKPKKCPTKELLIEWYDYDDDYILYNVRQWENASYYYDYTL